MSAFLPVPPFPLIIHVPINPFSPLAHQQYCTVRWTDSHLSLIFLCFWRAGGPSKWHLKNKKHTLRAYFDICLSVADRGGEVSICHQVPSDSQRECSLGHGPPAFVTETKSQTSFCLNDWSEHKTSSGLIMQRNTLFLFLFVEMLDFVKT